MEGNDGEKKQQQNIAFVGQYADKVQWQKNGWWDCWVNTFPTNSVPKKKREKKIAASASHFEETASAKIELQKINTQKLVFSLVELKI